MSQSNQQLINLANSLSALSAHVHGMLGDVTAESASTSSSSGRPPVAQQASGKLDTIISILKMYAERDDESTFTEDAAARRALRGSVETEMARDILKAVGIDYEISKQ